MARFGFGGTAHQAMRQIRAWHPRALNWAPASGAPYEGDPYSYLGFAREMGGFYDASVREPLFVLLTKAGLYLSNDHDVGITLASGVASVLLVLGTYLLGSYAFGRAVGLLAATGMAVERFVVGLSVQGWRDDTFALLVVLWAYALLRLRKEKTFGAAVIAGLIGGAACLTRITSLSFLVPGYGLLLLARVGWPPRRRLELVGVSVVLVLALVAPFLVNCAIVYGDPLYSINYHADFYLKRESRATARDGGWLELLRQRFRPFQLLDTAFIGVASYPFSNKWNGFDYWWFGLGRWLSYASLFGALAALWSPLGRMLWVVYTSALLPYAFTYETPGGAEWRFTLLAYPFLLIAAGLALATVARLVDPRNARRWVRHLFERRRTVARTLALNLGLVGSAWVLSCALYYMRVAETVRAGATARVHAGPRDALFLNRGWHLPRRRGAITVRASTKSTASLFLPLAEGRGYYLDFRLDPLTSHEGPMYLLVCAGGNVVLETTIERNAERLGSHTASLPGGVVEDGRNRIDLRVSAAPDGRCDGPRAEEGALLFWFVRVRPAPGLRDPAPPR